MCMWIHGMPQKANVSVADPSVESLDSFTSLILPQTRSGRTPWEAIAAPRPLGMQTVTRALLGDQAEPGMDSLIVDLDCWTDQHPWQ